MNEHPFAVTQHYLTRSAAVAMIMSAPETAEFLVRVRGVSYTPSGIPVPGLPVSNAIKVERRELMDFLSEFLLPSYEKAGARIKVGVTTCPVTNNPQYWIGG